MPALAATPAGLDTLRVLTEVTISALREGRRRRQGPVPAGGPAAVAESVRARLPNILPERGVGADEALRRVVGVVAEGAADPADPLCAAHLHTAPLAVAAAADLAASVLNPSLDSWDQAPAAAELERLVTKAIAQLTYPGRRGADSLVTTGATESNLVALLLARERLGPRLQVVCSIDSHHSVARAAWLLGLPPPIGVPTRNGTMDLEALVELLAPIAGPPFVVATAGTTNRGAIDPINPIAELTHRRGGHLHVDAAYGGGLLFSSRRQLIDGIERADTVALDLHKFGWQPLPAGLLAVRAGELLGPLSLTADYLNAEDDQEAGYPDLLGRSIRTSRRPDVLKIAVTFQALGWSGLAELTDRCLAAAVTAADLIESRPALRLLDRPGISTVLFRPVAADLLSTDAGNELVTDIRRTLLTDGTAVLGRASNIEDGLVWLKLTLLNPDVSQAQLDRLLDLVESVATESPLTGRELHRARAA
ncbi:MAG: pyridoxal phosphate-dependent decarboxylase family protein [Jatrophihabitantaceae bacterium]